MKHKMVFTTEELECIKRNLAMEESKASDSAYLKIRDELYKMRKQPKEAIRKAKGE